MATNTLSNITPGNQAYYDRNLLRRAVPADVHGRFGQNRPLKMRMGNQIKFRRYEALDPTTTALTEGVTPSGTTLTVTDVTATLGQYGAYVTITDMVDYTNQDPVLTEAGEVLGQQAGTSVDQIRRDVLVAGTNVVYTNGSARNTLNTVIDSIALRTTIRSLLRQDATFLHEMINATTGISTNPIRRAFCSIVHPDTEAHLESITGYIPVNEYSSAMRAEEDEVGAFRNIRFWCSTNSKVFIDAGAAISTDGMITENGVNNDVYASLVFAKDAYGVVPLGGKAMQNIIKPLGSGGTSDALDQRATSGWKAITTTQILNENFMTRIESTSLIVLV